MVDNIDNEIKQVRRLIRDKRPKFSELLTTKNGRARIARDIMKLIRKNEKRRK